MPNKHYIAGVRMERLLQHELENQGFLVIRAAGSHSPFDLVAVHRKLGDVRFIQVKTVKTNPQLLLDKFIGEVPLDFWQWQDTYTQELWVRHKRKWHTRVV